MRSASLSIGAGLVLALTTSSASALGFGAMRNQSALGQPLDFSVPLRFDEGEFVSVECINATVVAGETTLPASALRLTLEGSGQANERRLRVRTSAIIDEPIVQVNVSVGCPVQLQREFVAFIDPPVLTLAEAPPAPPPPAAPPPASAPTPAPAASTAEPGFVAAAAPPPPARAAAPAASAPPRPRPRPRPPPVVRPSSDLPVAPPVAATPRPASEVVQAAPAAPAATGPRLRLDPSEGVRRPPPPPPPASVAAAAPAPAPASAVAAIPPAAAAPLAAASQPVAPMDTASALAGQAAAALQSGASAAAAAASGALATAQQDRQQALESRLEQMTREAQATRDSIASLQARVREAEASRYANPLVYGLGGLALGLLAALGFLYWWSRERERQREAWWMAAAGEARQRQARRDEREDGTEIDSEARDERPVAAAPLVHIEPRTPQPGPVTWKPTFAIPELDTRDAPRRAVTAEELIDLGQQVEFFITLGQDAAAIDLLENHVAGTGEPSPLPYLKLLELYHERGQREDYERVRSGFLARFGASAPGWGESADAGRPLADHPDAVARIQEVWPTPARAMGLIESMMFRRQDGDSVFGLEACGDLLFLYEVARELGEQREGPVAVDLELPLDVDSGSVFEPARASAPMPLGGSGMSRTVNVDVDLNASQEEVERKFERSARYEDRDFSFGTGPGPLDDEPPASRPPRDRNRR